LLDSFVVFTELGDELTFEVAETDGLIIEGAFAGPLASEDPASNLIAKARNALRQHGQTQGYKCSGVQITLTKNLPIASGIGGGSSDAAAALSGLARLWNLAFDGAELAEIGISLGADVPMCLLGKPLFARGIGDDISLVTPFPSLALVLVNPGGGVSTPAMFKALKSKTNDPLGAFRHGEDIQAFCSWVARQRNDLQRPAIQTQPVIEDTLRHLEASGALLVRMSGSGATCFGIFEDIQSAERAAVKIGKAEPSWFVRATQTTPA
jgi:4-diphosphocytidyl-2-C-methyl-D-erythritol kinase